MKLSFPAYYNNFRCIAADCPDSCCKAWTVDVDPAAAAYYRQLPGALGERLRQVLQDTDDGTILAIENGRCPMWLDNGLCRIQSELGHDALCKTCRDFPRLRHDYGDFVELGLELSCPEAARLILTAKEYTTVQQTVPGGEDPEYDPQVMDALLESRRHALALLDDGRYPLPEKLAILLLYAHQVQGQIDGGDEAPFLPEECLSLSRKYATNGDLGCVLELFRNLEILTAQWAERLNKPAKVPSWAASYKELVRYLIGRYWLQAVSDFDLVCRVKFIIASCILTVSLGGDPICTAQLFSKEIENDPDNLVFLLNAAYSSPALTDMNLLGLLLA